MAKCKYCERKGLFFKVNKDSLCKDCNAVIYRDATNAAKIYNDSYEMIHFSNSPITISSCFSLLKEKIGDLKKYEEKGINVLDEYSEKIIEEILIEGNENIVNLLVKDHQVITKKIESLKTEKGKQNNLDKLISITEEFKSLLDSDGKNYSECLNALNNLVFEGKPEQAKAISEKVKKRLLELQRDMLADSLSEGYDGFDIKMNVIILTAGNSCDECKKFENKKYTIKQIQKLKPLPHAKCTHERGCRCEYSFEPAESVL